ncbi:MAG: hypothetical protein JWN62_1232 [Acidimicrobiales bacterium]|nr:hypothetical protein [Acidimicrobiales bacterium]
MSDDVASAAGGQRAVAYGWRLELKRVLALRYVVLASVALSAMVVAGGRGDWNVFVDAGRDMLGRDGLHVFARHGDIQTGPVTLLLAALFAFTPRNGFVMCAALCLVLGLLTLRLLELMRNRVAPSDPSRNAATMLVGGICLMFWWPKLGGYGHLDDCLVLSAAAGSVLAARAGRPRVAAVLVGIGIGIKPWAVILLPLTLRRSGALQSRVSATILALAIGAVSWLPFLIAVPRTLGSLRATVSVASDSAIRLFGFTDENLPAVFRTVQLMLVLITAFLAMRRGRVAGVMLAAIAARVVTDPGTWSYYTAGFVLAALVWDMCESNRTFPIATVIASCSLVPGWVVPEADARAVIRLLACAGAVTLVFWPRDEPGSADQLDPEPVRIPARIDR